VLTRSRTTSLVVILLLIAASCTVSADPRPVPAGASPDPTPRPILIELPRDELAHDSRLEWWYFNGHLESESGDEYGYHFVIFKSQDDENEPNYVAQGAVLDVAGKAHVVEARARAGGRLASSENPGIDLAGWSLDIGPAPGTFRIEAEGDAVGLDLQLEAQTDIMLHKEIGWIPTEAGATYYYSWPRQQTDGTITLNGEELSVEGTSWFDHQWGNFFVVGKPAGWQWFALLLSDGSALMVSDARGVDGESADLYATYMWGDGQISYIASGIDIDILDTWTSPHSGGEYPSEWRMTIDDIALDVTLQPVFNEQEVSERLPRASTYWEGKVDVSGTKNGDLITGMAYVELSGYVDPEPIEWLHR